MERNIVIESISSECSGMDLVDELIDKGVTSQDIAKMLWQARNKLIAILNGNIDHQEKVLISLKNQREECTNLIEKGESTMDKVREYDGDDDHDV